MNAIQSVSLSFSMQVINCAFDKHMYVKGAYLCIIF